VEIEAARVMLRAAVRVGRRLRRGTRGLVILPYAALCLFAVPATRTPFDLLPVFLLLVSLGALVAFALAVPLPGAVRVLFRHRLRSQLSRLPLDRRLEALRLLESDRDVEAREIVKPLLRRLEARPATEVVPSGPAAGRGNEPAAAG
jgi:hypothetical protein